MNPNIAQSKYRGLHIPRQERPMLQMPEPVVRRAVNEARGAAHTPRSIRRTRMTSDVIGRGIERMMRCMRAACRVRCRGGSALGSCSGNEEMTLSLRHIYTDRRDFPKDRRQESELSPAPPRIDNVGAEGACMGNARAPA
jgi:hypothetical protein